MTSVPAERVTLRARVGATEIEVSGSSMEEAVRNLREAQATLRASRPAARNEEAQMADLQPVREQLATAARQAAPGSAVTLEGTTTAPVSRSAPDPRNAHTGSASQPR